MYILAFALLWPSIDQGEAVEVSHGMPRLLTLEALGLPMNQISS
jgi:hypothetical protein